MSFFRKLLILIISVFFKIYFWIFGEPKTDNKLKLTLDLYNTKDFTQDFNKIRIWDAPYQELEKTVPKVGKILDLGCGDGLFANYLALSSLKRDVVGVELNKERLKKANRGLKNATFITDNALRNKFSKVNAITMIHLLHHLPSRKSQEELIKKSYRQLKPQGELIIAEISEKPFLKCMLTWFVDVFIVPMLFEGKFLNKNIFYRKDREWKNLLLKYGFKVQDRSLQKGKPFSHRLFIATKMNNEKTK